jgi:hypothetical protein
MEARQVYEALLDRGILDTVELRRITRMSSPASESRFNRTITDLQADFKILPVGVTQSGAWHYAFAYDIVARHYPDLPEDARAISEEDARLKLLAAYARSVGAFELTSAARLFGWKHKEIERSAQSLLEDQILARASELTGSQSELYFLPEILEA